MTITPPTTGANPLAALDAAYDTMIGSIGNPLDPRDQMLTSAALVEDSRRPAATPTTDASPPDWDAYIGQEHVKAELRIRIASALNRHAPIPSTLFVADGGTGKTTLARLVAQELGQELVVFTRPVKTDVLIDKLWPHAGRGAVVFFDEVHQWGKHANDGGQHALMQLLEARTLDTRSGQVMEFPHLSFIAATTDVQRLTEPFIGRFGCRPMFMPYTIDEMGLVIAGMAGRMGVGLLPIDTIELAKATAGSPRLARAFVEAARDLEQSAIEPTAHRVLALTATAPDGLSRDHLAYLSALANCPNGQAGLGSLSTLTGMPTERIRRLERLLADRHLVDLGHPSGRRITPNGRQRVAR